MPSNDYIFKISHKKEITENPHHVLDGDVLLEPRSGETGEAHRILVPRLLQLVQPMPSRTDRVADAALLLLLVVLPEQRRLVDPVYLDLWRHLAGGRLVRDRRGLVDVLAGVDADRDSPGLRVDGRRLADRREKESGALVRRRGRRGELLIARGPVFRADCGKNRGRAVTIRGKGCSVLVCLGDASMG